MKDMDGARVVEFEAIGDSVFVWGRGFSYEFDKGVFTHQMRRMLGVMERERVPLGGGTLCSKPCPGLSPK